MDTFKIVATETGANGVTYIEQKNILLVSNPLDREFYSYRIDRTTNELIKYSTVPTGLGIDNMYLDKSTGIVYGGALNVREFAFYLFSGFNKDKKISGGIVEIIPKVENITLTFDLKLLEYIPGRLYTGISVVGLVQDQFVLGSWYGEGILICNAN